MSDKCFQVNVFYLQNRFTRRRTRLDESTFLLTTRKSETISFGSLRLTLIWLVNISLVVDNFFANLLIFKNGIIRGTLLAYQFMSKDKAHGGTILNIGSSCSVKPFLSSPIYTGECESRWRNRKS